jgi:hypothetical protein
LSASRFLLVLALWRFAKTVASNAAAPVQHTSSAVAVDHLSRAGMSYF